MSTATQTPTRPAVHSVLTRPTFTLADRLKIQQQRFVDRDYIAVG